MTHHGRVPPDLEVVQPYLSFTVLEQPLDCGPAERDVQHGLEGRLLRGVGEEVFHLAGQHVAGHDQPALLAGQVVVPREEPRGSRLPDHRAFPGVFDVERLQRPPGTLGDLVDAPAATRSGGQPCSDAGPHHRRALQPAALRREHLHHVDQPHRRHVAAKSDRPAVNLVGGHILELHAVAYGTAKKIQGNHRLGPELHGIGDSCLAAPVLVGQPRLRQIQIAVDERLEIVRHITQVHADDAVIGLAGGAAILPLHAAGLKIRETSPEFDGTAPRWTPDSDIMQQLSGAKPLAVERGFEYGVRIIHGLETGAVHRVHLNVMNRGMIENLPDGYCVEVPCTVDRTGVSPHHVGALPIHLAALCRGIADMQTLASDAFLEKDLTKAYLACVIDPCTAASATPARIKECFNKLLEADSKWLEPYWGENLAL